MHLKGLSDVGAAQGIETVRRDNCLMVRKLVTVVLDKLLKERDPDGAVAYVKSLIADLLLNRVDMSDLVVSKSLSQARPPLPPPPPPHMRRRFAMFVVVVPRDHRTHCSRGLRLPHCRLCSHGVFLGCTLNLRQNCRTPRRTKRRQRTWSWRKR